MFRERLQILFILLSRQIFFQKAKLLQKLKFITYLKKFKVNFDKPPRIFIIAHKFAGIPLFPGRTARK